jgi:hypothetical protein
MRIPAREVLFTGQDRCPEFDVCRESPPELNVLLCLLDGAERRQIIQAKLSGGYRDLASTGAWSDSEDRALKR